MRAEARRHLAEVTRDRLGRFVSIINLRTCEDTGCRLPPVDVTDVLAQHDEFLAAVEGWLQSDDLTRAEVAQVVRSFRSDLRDDEAEILGPPPEGDQEPQPRRRVRRAHVWAVGRELPAILDVSGLDAPTARELALKLAQWNGPGRVYARHQGRRVLRGGEIAVDLADPLVVQLGWPEEIEASRAEGGKIVIDYGDSGSPDGEWAALYEHRYANEAAA